MRGREIGKGTSGTGEETLGRASDSEAKDSFGKASLAGCPPRGDRRQGELCSLASLRVVSSLGRVSVVF